MNSTKQSRYEYIHNHIIITHLVCIFILTGAIVKNLNLSPLEAHIFLIYFLILSIFFLAESALLYYFKKNKIFNKPEKISLIDITYITFPLAIAVLVLFITREHVSDIKTLFLLPILIAGSLRGVKTAYFFTFLGTTVIMVFDILKENTFNIVEIIESNFILISMMLLVGWFSGVISELELNYRQQLTNLANTDDLTQLFNHRYLQEKLRHIFSEISEDNPLSLIMIDIDDFKYYNDTHGHLQGDELLKNIGEILKKSVQAPGFAARYGGEEFVIVLPGMDSTGAAKTAEKIRNKIKARSFKGEEYQPKGKVTVSCGVATAPDHAKTSQELFEYADRALYKAKSLGKNRLEIFSSVFEELLNTVDESEKNLINSFQTLLQVINAKDRYTYGHSERVMEYSIKLASELNLPEKEIKLLRYAAFLHDVGKVEIDRNLLNKPANLNDQEFNTFKQHCRWGSEIVKAVPRLDKTAKIILYHHENYDGSGYPDGLSGKDIPLLARIIRIADSYDAMTSDRPYRKAMSLREALEEIKRCSGTLFDPELVKLFVKVMS